MPPMGHPRGLGGPVSAYQPQPDQLPTSPPTSPRGPQMTTQPDHATEAAELLACGRAAAAQGHALLAIHEQLADIARRLPRPVVNDLRAEVQPPAHPGGFVPEPEITIRGGRLTASVADEIRAQVANIGGMA